MTFGPASGLSIAAALLAVFFYWLIKRPVPLIDILALFVFGLMLAVVVLAGPLIKLP